MLSFISECVRRCSWTLEAAGTCVQSFPFSPRLLRARHQTGYPVRQPVREGDLGREQQLWHALSKPSGLPSHMPCHHWYSSSRKASCLLPLMAFSASSPEKAWPVSAIWLIQIHCHGSNCNKIFPVASLFSNCPSVIRLSKHLFCLSFLSKDMNHSPRRNHSSSCCLLGIDIWEQGPLNRTAGSGLLSVCPYPRKGSPGHSAGLAARSTCLLR